MRRHQRGHVGREKSVGTSLGQPEFGQHKGGDLGGLINGRRVVRGTTLGDGRREQASGARRAKVILEKMV